MSIESELLALLSKDKNLMNKLNQSLSLKPAATPKPRTVSTTHPPFVHKISGRCRLCGTDYEILTMMTWSTSTHAYYRDHTIKPDEDISGLKLDQPSYAHYDCQSCEHCEEYLSGLEKDALIKIILNLITPPALRRKP